MTPKEKAEDLVKQYKMEKKDLRKEVEEAVSNNLSQNAVYDDFLIDELMVILKKEIIKAFDVGLDIGDTRNYTGEKYYECKFILKLD